MDLSSKTKTRRSKAAPSPAKSYAEDLRHLQIELVKMQRHIIGKNLRLLLLFEGRDGSGKDGTIKRISEHMSPRDTRVVALGKPSDRERGSWYFQRYAAHLPSAGEVVLFNRSWYNRAGVEKVMGFCSDDEYQNFLNTVGPFESMLQGAGIILLKYFLDITQTEQKRRLDERRSDPLKQWKLSPIDAEAIKRWAAYTAARDTMLHKTSTRAIPWYIVDANHKKTARLEVIRHILSAIDYNGKDQSLAPANPRILTRFDGKSSKRLAR